RALPADVGHGGSCARLEAGVDLGRSVMGGAATGCIGANGNSFRRVRCHRRGSLLWLLGDLRSRTIQDHSRTTVNSTSTVVQSSGTRARVGVISRTPSCRIHEESI